MALRLQVIRPVTVLRKISGTLESRNRFKLQNKAVDLKVKFTMSQKKAIKVIKKVDLSRKQKPVEKTASARETAREMVQTVTNWVNELQQKRRTEAVKALKTFLPENPRPSEA